MTPILMRLKSSVVKNKSMYTDKWQSCGVSVQNNFPRQKKSLMCFQSSSNSAIYGDMQFIVQTAERKVPKNLD